MTEAELDRLAELLAKAKELMPQAEFFKVERGRLIGEFCHVYNGQWYGWELTSTGVKERTGTYIY